MYAAAKLACSIFSTGWASPRSTLALVRKGPTSPNRRRLVGSSTCFESSSSTAEALKEAPLLGDEDPSGGSMMVSKIFTEPAAKPTTLMRSRGTPTASAMARENLLAKTASVCNFTTSIVRSSKVISTESEPCAEAASPFVPAPPSKSCAKLAKSSRVAGSGPAAAVSSGSSTEPSPPSSPRKPPRPCPFTKTSDSSDSRVAKPTGGNPHWSSSSKGWSESGGEAGLGATTTSVGATAAAAAGSSVAVAVEAGTASPSTSSGTSARASTGAAGSRSPRKAAAATISSANSARSSPCKRCCGVSTESKASRLPAMPRRLSPASGVVSAASNSARNSSAARSTWME
mmetsp:Transcript_33621/g.71449  ORF Transcript_33621/g.71449 Transcript_33621/m.71449 type:complete len:344 (-) Transcript_33621:1239-2270(-)